MFNLRRNAKSTPKATPKVKKFDTGRTSTRNKVNAYTEANRQAKLYKKGAQGS